MTSSTYYSAIVAANTAKLANQRLRDLNNPALSSYYPPFERISEDEILERVQDAQSFYANNGLPGATNGQLVSDITNPTSVRLFVQVLESCGIENTYDPDLIEIRTQTSGSVRSEILEAIERNPKLANRQPNTRTSLHLKQPQINLVGEVDSRVHDGLRFIHDYLRQYFS